MKVTKGLIEQHIHGAFGIDFMKCSSEEMIYCSELLLKNGVCAFFPAIMTDSIDVIRERISVIKKAKSVNNKNGARIEGIHLEGPFINPNRAGIHEKKYILPLLVDLYKKIEDEIIKIITIAPELDAKGDFIKYLSGKNIKVSAGHTEAAQLQGVSQVTHLYNAMLPFHHRNSSTVTASLVDDDIYTELIADSMHVCDDVLKITFKQKSLDKIILISDALPLAHSDISEMIFAGHKIYNKNGKLIDKDGVIAGSSFLLSDIVKNLADKNIVSFDEAIQCASVNIAKYHNIQNNLNVYWNDLNIIEKVELNSD